MNLLQALVIAFVQGATELFPISSLGHAVVLPGLLGWHVDQHSRQFLPYLVVLHLGTAAALLLYFWRDWLGFLKGVLSRGPEGYEERRLFTLVVLATCPAVVLGLLFEHLFRDLFASPSLAAGFLILNGFMLYFGDRLPTAPRQELSKLSWKAALAIGACQALALFPGLSRSGATLIGGRIAGLTHKDAARFSFLMATPIILGAAVLEVPKLFHNSPSGQEITEYFPMSTLLAGGVVAGLVAWLSLFLLMRYFKKHEINALWPFAYYCWGAGLLALAVLGLQA